MTTSPETRSPVLLVPVLIGVFGAIFVALGAVYDWKTMFAAFLACPVGIAILLMSRNEANPIDRINAADAGRARARQAKAQATNTVEHVVTAQAA